MWRRDHEWTVWGGLVVTSALTLLIVVTLGIISLVVVGAFFTHQAIRFSQASDTSLSELASYGWAAVSRRPIQTNGRKNILILGLDQLDNRGDAPILTDTMLVVSLDLQTTQAYTLPIPRDLWLPTYQSKVNSLYYFSQQQSGDPVKLPRQAIAELTGLQLHHTVVITLEQLAELIDLVGGVEINVPVAFSDPLFPRTDVDVTVERDPAKLYKTVTFEAGAQTLNGQRALEYIRSRKSSGTTGGDDARTLRQQQVIAALIQRVTNPATFTQPSAVAPLLRYYRQYFAEQLSLGEAAATAYQLWPTRAAFQLNSNSLSIYPTDPQGVLVHPPENQYNGQWVYIVRNPTAFSNEVNTKLHLSSPLPTPLP